MFTRLIQVKNGKYKIRRWIFMFGFEYLDMIGLGEFYWSTSGHEWIEKEEALLDYEEAKEYFKIPKVRVVSKLK